MNLPSQIIGADPVNVSANMLLPQVDAAEVEALAASIDTRSALTIAQFGHAVGETTSRYADQLLSRARADDLDEIGGKLTEIVLVAQAFDLSSLDSKWARVPIVGGLVRNFVLTREKAVARFSSLEDHVDKLVGNIQGTLVRLEERAASFDAMYEGVTAEHRMLATHVKAAEIVLARLDGEIASLRICPQDQDMEGIERINALEGSRQALEKRIGDLNVLQHSALQTLPMIRMMQANNVVLLEKFQTILRLTLPAWKRAFVLALTLNEQREAVNLANSIDDATNYFMKRNSEILYENAVAIAQANQRLVVDVATLREVHDNVIKTLVDVRKAHEDGVAKRHDALVQLEHLRAEMAFGLTNVLPNAPPGPDMGKAA